MLRLYLFGLNIEEWVSQGRGFSCANQNRVVILSAARTSLASEGKRRTCLEKCDALKTCLEAGPSVALARSVALPQDGNLWMSLYGMAESRSLSPASSLPCRDLVKGHAFRRAVKATRNVGFSR
jgi:hypothetical protein